MTTPLTTVTTLCTPIPFWGGGGGEGGVCHFTRCMKKGKLRPAASPHLREKPPLFTLSTAIAALATMSCCGIHNAYGAGLTSILILRMLSDAVMYKYPSPPMTTFDMDVPSTTIIPRCSPENKKKLLHHRRQTRRCCPVHQPSFHPDHATDIPAAGHCDGSGEDDAAETIRRFGGYAVGWGKIKTVG